MNENKIPHLNREQTTKNNIYTDYVLFLFAGVGVFEGKEVGYTFVGVFVKDITSMMKESRSTSPKKTVTDLRTR